MRHFFGLGSTLGLIIPVVLFPIAVSKIGSGSASILSAIELLFIVTVSVLLLHVSVNLVRVFGMDLILVGMMLSSIKLTNCERVF
ncbi:EamA family transporter [Bacillus sp. 37MA]|uniref:EamA family transporter n=1 Tax=Bacillaceae TaxID=186817 RepID=UPI0009E22B3B